MEAIHEAPTSDHIEPGGSSMLRQNSASFFALLEILIRALGGINTSTTLMLEDNGETENFITHAIAKKLELTKKPTTIFIKVIEGEFRQLETFIYYLEVVNVEGVGHQIELIGVNSITEVGCMEGVQKLWNSFPSEPEAAAAAFRRPHIGVSLMIGMRNRELHCTDWLGPDRVLARR